MLRYIIIASVAVILITLGLICFFRVKKFRPNPNKREQLARLNSDLKPSGFAYDYSGDYFYSLHNCWQKEAGYCSLYDDASPLFNMIMDCEPIAFDYDGKRWLIEMWKGQYGITTGAEVGVYTTDREDIHSERFTGAFYDAANASEELYISFILYKNGKKLLKRSGRGWWLTAFKLGEYSKKSSLTMKVKIQFPNAVMLSAFTEALIQTGYNKGEFRIRHNTIVIDFTTPHSPQPALQDGISEKAVQRANKTNCFVYKSATDKFSYTPDKLEYIRSFMPELYEFMLRSLYGREFFKTDRKSVV